MSRAMPQSSLESIHRLSHVRQRRRCRPEGSVARALNTGRGAVLICCERAEITATFVQMAPLRTRGGHLCGWVVSAILALLSYVEELLTERALPADHTTIWRWVQRYAPELSKRYRRELKPTNGS